MKIRNDFVSNSSSSSFIVRQKKDIRTMMRFLSLIEDAGSFNYDEWELPSLRIYFNDKLEERHLKEMLEIVYDAHRRDRGYEYDDEESEDSDYLKNKEEFVKHHFSDWDKIHISYLQLDMIRFIPRKYLDEIDYIDVYLGENCLSNGLNLAAFILLMARVMGINIDTSHSERSCDIEDEYMYNHKLYSFIIDNFSFAKRPKFERGENDGEC